MCHWQLQYKKTNKQPLLKLNITEQKLHDRKYEQSISKHIHGLDDNNTSIVQISKMINNTDEIWLLIQLQNVLSVWHFANIQRMNTITQNTRESQHSTERSHIKEYGIIHANSTDHMS
jgi:hypothetical protein